MNRIEKGIVTGILALMLWESQRNPSKVYIGGRRIHHGLVEAVLTIFAKDPFWKTFGATLALHDLKDAKDWL